MVEQNLFLCFLCSAVAGFMTVASRAVVVKQAQMRKGKKGEKLSSSQKFVVVSLFLLFEASSNVVNLAPWFGPVSLVYPTFLATKLVSNILLIGVLMKHEKIEKNAVVATGVMISSAVFLQMNGPGIQEYDDLREVTIDSPMGLAWLAILVVPYIPCSCLMIFSDLRKRSKFYLEGVMLCVSVGSAVLSQTVSKYAIMADDPALKAGLFAVVVVINIIWTIEVLKEPLLLESMTIFNITYTFGSLTFSAITGFLVWREDKVINNWTGVALTYFQMALAVFLTSEIGSLKRVDEELQEYQELILYEIYHPKNFFAGNIPTHEEEAVKRARLEYTLNKHQLTIFDHSNRTGLKRGNSDPEIQASLDGSSIHAPETSALISHGASSKLIVLGRTSLHSTTSERELDRSQRSGSQRVMIHSDGLSHSGRGSHIGRVIPERTRSFDASSTESWSSYNNGGNGRIRKAPTRVRSASCSIESVEEESFFDDDSSGTTFCMDNDKVVSKQRPSKSEAEHPPGRITMTGYTGGPTKRMREDPPKRNPPVKNDDSNIPNTILCGRKTTEV